LSVPAQRALSPELPLSPVLPLSAVSVSVSVSAAAPRPLVPASAAWLRPTPAGLRPGRAAPPEDQQRSSAQVTVPAQARRLSRSATA